MNYTCFSTELIDLTTKKPPSWENPCGIVAVDLSTPQYEVGQESMAHSPSVRARRRHAEASMPKIH